MSMGGRILIDDNPLAEHMAFVLSALNFDRQPRRMVEKKKSGRGSGPNGMATGTVNDAFRAKRKCRQKMVKASKRRNRR
jgi:hypothetical protein